MSIAVVEREPATPGAADATPDAGEAGLRLMVLARIACQEGATRPELGRELGPLAAPGPQGRLQIDTELAQLVRSGHAIETKARFTASPEGLSRLKAALRLKALPRTWAELRDMRLVARALGLERESPARLKKLSKPDVLRAEIVTQAYGLKVKGASASKLRAALALVALERAFGNRIKGELSASAGLNAKASRVLAGQLLKKPRDAGTDGRLVALIAAEAVGSAKVDADHLRAALLRRLAARGLTPKLELVRKPAAPPPPDQATQLLPDLQPSQEVLPEQPEATPSPAPEEASLPPLPPVSVTAEPAAELPVRPPAASRPDLPGFVQAVQVAAAAHAEGWPGNRKTLVSRVFDAIVQAHPSWGLSLVELKAMLVECHRLGHLALVTADLKDKGQLDELRASAIAYKNTVWHLVRVEE
jgi:hypothetical protein